MVKKIFGDSVTAGLVALVILSALSKVWVALTLEINWDEFLFLSHIYSLQSGSLSKVLQTGYVHLFMWVTHVPGNEIDQVIAGRLMMWVAHCGSLVVLYLLGRDLFGRRAALFSLFVFSTFSYVTLHAASFRADPLVGFLIVSATYLIYSRDPGPKMILATTFLVATATLISIKTVLFVPMMSMIAVLRLAGRPDAWRLITIYAVMAALTVAIFLAFFTIHRHIIGTGITNGFHVNIGGAYSFVIRLDQPFAQWSYLDKTLTSTDPYYYLVLAIGLILLGLELLSGVNKKRALNIAALTSPFLIFIFYQNAFPYFYPLIICTSSLLAGYVWKAFCGESRPRGMMLLPIALLFIFSVQIFRDGFVKPQLVDQSFQRQIFGVVHRMFPNPVTYIDGNSMIASFPKAGLFMSNWGISRYLDLDEPVIARAIKNDQPKFLLRNTPSRVFEKDGSGEPPLLLAEDRAAINDHYIPHWGPIWVAGKSLTMSRGETAVADILIPGKYTLESEDHIWIDGGLVQPKEMVHLNNGRIHLQNGSVNQKVVLRYGSKLYRPEFKPVSTLVYKGFL